MEAGIVNDLLRLNQQSELNISAQMMDDVPEF
jgi:hypothetical protein